MIPVKHAALARELAPSATVKILPNCGHFPHRDHPDRFVKIVRDFVRRQPAATYDPQMWRDTLRSGGVELHRAEAGHAPVDPISLPSA